MGHSFEFWHGLNLQIFAFLFFGLKLRRIKQTFEFIDGMEVFSLKSVPYIVALEKLPLAFCAFGF